MLTDEMRLELSNQWKFAAGKVPTMGIRLVQSVILLAWLGCTGCYSPRSLDPKMQALAERSAAEAVGISDEVVADSAQVIQPPQEPIAEPVELNVNRVLSIAAASSRNLQDRRDDLYSAGLTLFGTRRDFGVNINGTVEYVMSSDEDGNDRRDGSLNLALERILPTGARARLVGTQEVDDDDSRGGETYNASAQARIDQPLLSGVGYGASHEDLIQAERDYTYALRQFSLERQEFAINIVRQYYNLLGQRKVLENTRTNYQQFVFLRQRSDALFKVNRAPAIDVLRSQQEELSALNRLVSTEESYRINVGRFLILLGLPSQLQADLADDIPDLRKVDL